MCITKFRHVFKKVDIKHLFKECNYLFEKYETRIKKCSSYIQINVKCVRKNIDSKTYIKIMLTMYFRNVEHMQ